MGTARATTIINFDDLSGSGVLGTYAGVVWTNTGYYDAAQPPYTVGLVELDDGVRVYGRVVDVDHDALRDGLRLRVTVGSAGGQPIWHFGRE